jgi:hypothetical protein
MKSSRLIMKFIEIDRNNRFAESLSFLGKTIASSYLNDDAIIIIPTKER